MTRVWSFYFLGIFGIAKWYIFYVTCCNSSYGNTERWHINKKFLSFIFYTGTLYKLSWTSLFSTILFVILYLPTHPSFGPFVGFHIIFSPYYFLSSGFISLISNHWCVLIVEKWIFYRKYDGKWFICGGVCQGGWQCGWDHHSLSDYRIARFQILLQIYSNFCFSLC